MKELVKTLINDPFEEARMETVGKRIAKLRSAKKMTQKMLATELECHENTIAQWETGRALPNAVMLIELSEVFGVTTDYILKGGNR